MEQLPATSIPLSPKMTSPYVLDSAAYLVRAKLRARARARVRAGLRVRVGLG